MFEKHLWKSDNLVKDAGLWPASLLQMSLFHRCCSNIAVAMSDLSMIGTLVENGLKSHLWDKFASFFFFFNLDFICLRVPEHITTNKHISYKTNSTWCNLKPTKSHSGISGKLVVMYNIYSPECNYFRREEGKFLSWGETHQIQLNNTPKLHFFLNHQPPNPP